MFCPKCAAPNDLEQSYCRKCGQALTGVRMALRGSPAESLEQLRAGERSISSGGITLAVFAVIAVAISVIGSVLAGVDFSLSVAINLAIGLAISLPLILSGRASLRRAMALISSASDGLESKSTTGLEREVQPGTRPESPPLPGSVTEDTTLELSASRERGDGALLEVVDSSIDQRRA
jgi:hypothetical protein